MEPFIGEIRLFGFNFAPRGWAFCNGQLLSIAQNTALFSLIGTYYGGNGQTTFALPNLQGRVPIHQGQGPGLTPRTIGEMAGTEVVTLIQTEIPMHNHLIHTASAAGNSRIPNGKVLAKEAAGQTAVYADGPMDSALNPQSVSIAGGSQPHNNMPPFLVINYCIALEGIYPSRS